MAQFLEVINQSKLIGSVSRSLQVGDQFFEMSHQ